MTPDDAIALVQKYGKDAQVRVDGYSTWQDAACVLAVEVESLRDQTKFVSALNEAHSELCDSLKQERDGLRRRVEKAEESLSGWREGYTGKALAKIKAEAVREACDKVLLDYRAVSFDKNENLYLNVGALRDYANQIEGGE